jgi:peptidoglycan hydrolase-like protein with peptidoglycan-binding domain
MRFLAGGVLCGLAISPAFAQKSGGGATGPPPMPSSQATTPPGGSADTDVPTSRKSRAPEFDSNQQRQESLQADRDRKSGALNPYQGSRPASSVDTSNSSGREGPTGSANPNGSGKMTSSEVRQIQAVLKGEGYDPGPIDGVMGTRTQEALRSFQSAQNLQTTGEVNAETLKKLGIGESARQ